MTNHAAERVEANEVVVDMVAGLFGLPPFRNVDEAIARLGLTPTTPNQEQNR